ncbi:MAG: nucleotidyltransferase domain-containing protein, partial [Gemmatimonadaceae bacterium]
MTDWPRFVGLAERHAVLQLVSRQLATLEAGRIPEDVISRASEVARLGAVRGLQLTGQLVSIVQELDRRGIEAMPVKGPTLAALVYGDLSLRLYEDLDILVRLADVDAATKALRAMGYREARTFNDSRDALIPESHHQAFIHSESGTPVELHWSLTHRTLARDSLENQWWQHRRELSLGGASIQTLGAEPLILYLCMHGGKHSWARLGWLADLNQALRKFSPLDWDIVWNLARDGG